MFAVEDDLVQPIHSWYEWLGILLSEIDVIVLQHSLHLFELVPRYALEHEHAVLGVVEEGTTLAWGDQLWQSLEIAIEEVAQDVVGAQTWQVFLLGDAWDLSDLREYLRSIVKENTLFDMLFVGGLVWCHTELRLIGVVWLGHLEVWQIESGLHSCLYAYHDAENHVEIVMHWVDVVHC